MLDFHIVVTDFFYVQPTRPVEFQIQPCRIRELMAIGGEFGAMLGIACCLEFRQQPGC